MRRHVVLVIAALLLLAGCGVASTARPLRLTAATSPSAPAGSWRLTHPIGSGGHSNLAWAVCNGATDCWADGNSQQGSSYPLFLEHWDGRSWTSSSPAGSLPASPTDPGKPACLASGFCVVPIAGGSVAIDSVVGGRWTAMPSEDPTSALFPDANVDAVSCVSETLCVGTGSVGNGSTDRYLPLALVWNGNHWALSVLPVQGTDPIQSLVSVSCGSRTSCVAVGVSERSSDQIGHAAIAERWDGSSWSSLALPVGVARLDDISCVSAASCYAIGATQNSAVVLHWNGQIWVTEALPFTRPGFVISCASDDLCMALERTSDKQPLGTEPVELRLHGRWFTVTGYPAPAEDLDGAACSTGGCLVVGEARSTPSSSATDAAGGQTTAAFYDIGATGSTTTSSSTTGAPHAPPAGGVAGLWTGRVTQHDKGAPPEVYEVLMNVRSTTGGTLTGRTIYPSLNCAGNLALRGRHGDRYTFREKIYFGLSRCGSGGTIVATVSGNSMSWRWSASGTRVVGVLHRAYSNLKVTGDVTATLTAPPHSCSVSKGVHTIQVDGSDSGGASVTLTVTDQQKGGWAQLLRGGKAFLYKGFGKLAVTPTSATLDNIVMPEADGAGHGSVTVGGFTTCGS